jgi:hypothetical protein
MYGIEASKNDVFFLIPGKLFGWSGRTSPIPDEYLQVQSCFVKGYLTEFSPNLSEQTIMVWPNSVTAGGRTFAARGRSNPA